MAFRLQLTFVRRSSSSIAMQPKQSTAILSLVSARSREMVVDGNNSTWNASLASLIIALPLRPSDYPSKPQRNSDSPSHNSKRQSETEYGNGSAIDVWSGYDADTESGDGSGDEADDDCDCDDTNGTLNGVRSTCEASMDRAVGGTVVSEAALAAAGRPQMITVGRASTRGICNPARTRAIARTRTATV
jgi:hypothetical protein